MKINAINNTNFRGLFTDKTAQNGGNWRMEYSPYSWESNNSSKMANKKKIDVYASSLPDNEEIYTKFENGGENSKDILGTESYYKHSDGKMRRTITEVPSMNREESLKVQNKKYDAFLDMKKDEFRRLRGNVTDVTEKVDNSITNFRRYADDIPLGFFAAAYDRRQAVNQMSKEFNTVVDSAKNAYTNFLDYDKLRISADNVRSVQKRNAEEIEKLADLRKSGRLIDISRRDIADADKPLIESLTRGFNTIRSKFVCLPHRLISMDEVMRSLGRASEVPANKQLIIDYIKRLI